MTEQSQQTEGVEGPELRANLPDGRVVRASISASGFAVGRDPGSGGLIVDAEDQTISSTAFKVTSVADGVRIENRSSFATLEVTNERGLRLLFPGEALLVAGNANVVLVGAIYTHNFEIRQPVQEAPVVAPTGTQPLAGSDLVLSGERQLVLSALCLSRFYPDRFGVALLNAREISKLLSRSGTKVTPRAVNNKIQRIREQLSSRHDVYLETREDLADFVIRHGHITMVDARRVLEQDGGELAIPNDSEQ